VRLHEIIAVYLDAILSPLDSNPKLPVTEISLLKSSLAAEMLGASTPDRKLVTQNAVNVCDWLSKCMEDRATSVAKMRAMAKTSMNSGATDVHKNLSSGGPEGGEKARAKLDQQRMEREDLNKKANQERSSFVANLKRTWASKTSELRQGVMGSYTRQLQLEALEKSQINNMRFSN